MIYIKRFCWVIFITFFSVLIGCAFLVNVLIIQPCVMFYFYIRFGDLYDAPDTCEVQIDMTNKIIDYLKPPTNDEIREQTTDDAGLGKSS